MESERIMSVCSRTFKTNQNWVASRASLFCAHKGTFLMSKFRLKCHIARSKAREKLIFMVVYPQTAGAAEGHGENQKGKKLDGFHPLPGVSDFCYFVEQKFS